MQVAYDKKPDLLDLLKNMDEFKKTSDKEQRQRLGFLFLSAILHSQANAAGEDPAKDDTLESRGP